MISFTSAFLIELRNSLNHCLLPLVMLTLWDLGIEFTWHHHSDGHVSVNLTQQSFVETLLETLGFSSRNQSTFTTPYHSGISIDTIPTQPMSSSDRDKL